jgi:hypothetical protein
MYHVNLRSCVPMLDRADPESEELTEPTLAEETNPELAEGKHQCITPPSLTLLKINTFC